MSSGGWFDRIVTVPLRLPVATITAVLMVTALSFFAWPHVRFEPDVSQLLPSEHPHVRIAQLLEDRSRPSRTMWLLLHGEGLADGRELQEVVPELATRLARSPDIVEVLTTREQLFAQWTERFAKAPLWLLDEAQLADLGQALSEQGVARAVQNLAEDLADDPVAARELALRDPLGLRWVLSSEDRFRELGFAPGTNLLLLQGGERAVVQLRGSRDAYDAEFSTGVCTFVDEQLAAIGVTAEIFGGYAVARADQARLRGDFERASTWSVLLIALYLVWVMRGLRLPMLVQLPAMLSIAWAIPFGSFFFGALPTVAVAAVAVLCGLGVDFAIHYAARYRRARLTMAHREAVQEVQRTTVPELLIDMATTAVTFLAIGAGSDGGLRAFGLLLAIGLVGSVLLTIFMLPILLRWSGDRHDPERSLLSSCSDRWLRHPSSRPVAWGVIALAIAGIGSLAVSGIPLSAETESIRPANDPVAAARQSIETQIGFSTVPVLVLWPADQDASPLLHGLQQSQAASDVRFWTGLDRSATAAGRQAVASCRERIQGFGARAEKQLDHEGLAPEAFRPALDELEHRFAADSPETDAVVVDYLGVKHRAVTVWPQHRLGLAPFEAFEQRLQERCQQPVILHGGPSMLRALEELLSRDLLRACWVAALLAVVMVTLWLRSLRYGLLALVPSAIGLVITLVLLQLLEIPLSMISFVAVPFVLGIGVDEGVHLVGHFRHARSGNNTGSNSTGATGVGIVRTSIGTVLGFSALLLAESPGLQLLGGIVAFGSIACMLSCLFVLAPLLAKRAIKQSIDS
ncbi:MAG: putative RND superfamily exporter protein [Planctomycetota bacterium]